MHEFGLGEEVVRAVLEELKRIAAPHRLRSVRVVLGELRRVSPDQLRFAYEALTRDTAAAGSVLEVTVLPAKGQCPGCGFEGWSDPPLCPQCGDNLRTLQGMELLLGGLEVECDADHALVRTP